MTLTSGCLSSQDTIIRRLARLGKAGKARYFWAFRSNMAIIDGVSPLLQDVARAPTPGGLLLEDSLLDQFGDVAQRGVR